MARPLVFFDAHARLDSTLGTESAPYEQRECIAGAPFSPQARAGFSVCSNALGIRILIGNKQYMLTSMLYCFMFRINTVACCTSFPRDRPRQGAACTGRRTDFAASTHSRSTFALTRKYEQDRHNGPVRGSLGAGGPFIFSNFRTLLRAQKRQPSHSQWLPHSLTHSTKYNPSVSSHFPTLCVALLHKSENQLLCFHSSAHDFVEMGGTRKITVVVFTVQVLDSQTS